MLINPCIILCQLEDKSTDRPGGHGRIATLDPPIRACRPNIFRRLRMSVSTYVCLFARLRRNCLTEWIQLSAALCDTDLQMIWAKLDYEQHNGATVNFQIDANGQKAVIEACRPFC